MTGRSRPRSARLRWTTASELLRLVHSEPRITRTEARARLGLSSGAAAELIERLRGAGLLAEHRAPPAGPGRPTTTLGAHPRGPLVAVVDLRSGGWRIVLSDLTGGITEVASGVWGDEDLAGRLPAIAGEMARAVSAHAGRIRAVVAAVAGTVSGSRLLQFSTRGWGEADLGVLTGRIEPPGRVRLLAGNDATLGGLAEARTGAARDARVALHVLVAVGVGGVLLVDGRPVTGVQGADGEYGHLPFGDPELRCPCGARGCWDLTVDGRALARHLGAPVPDDPVAYAQGLLDDVRSGRAGDSAQRRAVDLTAHALGAGIAGLVNLHGPEVVTLAGVATDLRAAAPVAFARGFDEGLMRFRRDSPPLVRDGLYSRNGPVRGAIGLGVEEITSPAALAEWGSVTS
ncbi:ROK family transcriptional regulator [Propionicicella superfundia]|uniref:ROK family transcriptional regulator n=1 Tax=Propionicicella superfundia TaxID=348582 RepID=UPI000402DF2C|nr:ROK family transcriptional regulator [Propionicicella superfundia]